MAEFFRSVLDNILTSVVNLAEMVYIRSTEELMGLIDTASRFLESVRSTVDAVTITSIESRLKEALRIVRRDVLILTDLAVRSLLLDRIVSGAVSMIALARGIFRTYYERGAEAVISFVDVVTGEWEPMVASALLNMYDKTNNILLYAKDFVLSAQDNEVLLSLYEKSHIEELQKKTKVVALYIKRFILKTIKIAD